MRMIDQEKVITALECCKDVHQAGRWASGCISCGYADKNRPDCFLSLADDALELLKEQEPAKVGHLSWAKVTLHEEIVFEDVCENCSSYLLKHWKACPICGKPVKWE